MLLDASKLAAGNGPELMGHVGIPGGLTDQSTAFHDQDFGFGDNLSRKYMPASTFQTEHISCQMEGADLPPAIGQYLVGSDCAGEDFVEIFRGFVFAVNLGIPPENSWAHPSFPTTSTPAGPG